MGSDVMEANAVEDFGGVIVHVGGGLIVEAEGAEVAGHGDFVGGEIRVHFDGAGGLDEAEVFAEVVEIDLAKSLSQDIDPPHRWPEMAGNDTGECAFAAAVGAEDGCAG